MENWGRRLQRAGAPTLGFRPRPQPSNSRVRSDPLGQGPLRSHLMNQIGDLVFPPLLACWLLTFLLQGRKRNREPVGKKSSFSHSQEVQRRGLRNECHGPNPGDRSEPGALSMYILTKVTFIKAII